MRTFYRVWKCSYQIGYFQWCGQTVKAAHQATQKHLVFTNRQENPLYQFLFVRFNVVSINKTSETFHAWDAHRPGFPRFLCFKLLIAFKQLGSIHLIWILFFLSVEPNKLHRWLISPFVLELSFGFGLFPHCPVLVGSQLLVNNHLQLHLSRNSILTPRQSSLRAIYSTHTSTVTLLTNDLCSNLSKSIWSRRDKNPEKQPFSILRQRVSHYCSMPGCVLSAVLLWTPF